MNSKQKKSKSITHIHYLKWVVFTLILALLPLFLQFLLGVIVHEIPSQLLPILSSGEIFLISCTISATVLGDMIINSNDEVFAQRVYTGVAALFLVLFSASTFTLAKIPNISNSGIEISLDDNMLIMWEVILFLGSVVIGIYALTFAEEIDQETQTSETI